MSEYLFDAISIVADMLPDGSIYLLAILLGGELDQEVPCVDLEQRRQQLMIIDIQRVHRIAIAARTRVQANVDSLLRAEAAEDPAHSSFSKVPILQSRCTRPYALVNQFDETLKKMGICPRIPRVVFQSEATWREADISN